MSAAREEILGRIRDALGRGPLGPEARAALDRRLAHPRPNLLPARAREPAARRSAQFIAMAEASSATVARLDSETDIPGAVVDYLSAHDLGQVIAVAPALAQLSWTEYPKIRIRIGRGEAGDRVALTPALAGIAETGTLMLVSGPDTPTTLNFLPASHIVVLAEADILGAYEDGFARLRRDIRDGATAPRTINLITGPSRTADIEHRLHMGAHGPARVHILIVARP